jgi:hypothetical protein
MVDSRSRRRTPQVTTETKWDSGQPPESHHQGKLSWSLVRNPKAPSATAFVRASARRCARTARRHPPARSRRFGTVCAWPVCSTGAPVQIAPNEALPPIRWSAGLPRFVARGRLMLRSRPGLESRGSRRHSKLRLDYAAGPGVAGSPAGIASHRSSSVASARAVATLRRRGLSSQDSRHRCRCPAPALLRLRGESLPHVPPVRISHCWASRPAAEAALSPCRPAPPLACASVGPRFSPGPYRPVTSSQT